MRTQLIEFEKLPVLATGFTINHDKTFQDDHAFLMQHVKVFNYENKQLLTAIDHTWYGSRLGFIRWFNGVTQSQLVLFLLSSGYP